MLPSKRGAVVLADPDYHFTPLWEVATNRPFCYLIRETWQGPDGATISEQSFEMEPVSPTQLLAVDLAAAKTIEDTVQQTLDGIGVDVFAVPVHAATLADKADKWLSEVWPLVLPIFDQVFFEVIVGRSRVTIEDVEKALNTLSEFGRPVLLRIAPRTKSFARASDFPVVAVGFDGGFCEGPQGESCDFQALIAATQSKVPAYVFGLSSVSTTTAVINAGFSYVGSESIAPTLRRHTKDDVSDDPAELLRALMARQSRSRDT